MTAHPDPNAFASPAKTNEVERTERTLTLLMVAKLRREAGGEGLCRIRNVSTGGLMIETRMAIAVGERIAIEVRGRPELLGLLVWVRDGRAGMVFDTEVAIEDMIALAPISPSRIRKTRLPRGPRVSIDCAIEVKLGGGRVVGMLRDISQGGAKLIIPIAPARHERLVLMIPGLPMKLALVCWAGPETGVAFAEPLSFEMLAEWLLIREGDEYWGGAPGV